MNLLTPYRSKSPKPLQHRQQVAQLLIDAARIRGVGESHEDRDSAEDGAEQHDDLAPVSIGEDAEDDRPGQLGGIEPAGEKRLDARPGAVSARLVGDQE